MSNYRLAAGLLLTVSRLESHLSLHINVSEIMSVNGWWTQSVCITGTCQERCERRDNSAQTTGVSLCVALPHSAGPRRQESHYTPHTHTDMKFEFASKIIFQIIKWTFPAPAPALVTCCDGGRPWVPNCPIYRTVNRSSGPHLPHWTTATRSSAHILVTWRCFVQHVYEVVDVCIIMSCTLSSN